MPNTPGFKDFQVQANVSDYKWLSKTLKTAQQQPAVRPFYQCKVIDDSVVGNSVAHPLQPTQGSACTAPDGRMYAVGLSSISSVGIWIGSPGVLSGSPSTTLVDTAHDRSSLNHYSIRCSDWINGTYKLDVYAFGNWDNFNASGFLSILHWYSMDKGNTWFTDQVVNTTQIPYNQTSNIWLAAGKPFQNSAGAILSTVFYIVKETVGTNIYEIGYQQYLGSGGTYQGVIYWSKVNINTRDWNLHSLDVEYINGYWYVAFAGFHKIYDATNQNSAILNYDIYLTKIVNYSNTSDLVGEPKAIWTSPVQIISSLSSSPQNKNSFTYPSLFWDETNLWVFFKGDVVTSILNDKGSTNVTTTTNYFFAKSADLKNFNYPVPVILNNAAFSDTVFYSFFSQGGSYRIAGGGYSGDFTINSTLADISNDILNYEAVDAQRNPSTLSLTIGNQNGQWRGSAPTMAGYSAIANNKKVALFQGYYNASGVAEVAPKNTYYIDDIQQNVEANRNDLHMLSRDLYKNLKVLKTKFAYNFTGIKKYVDIFDGTTMGNYNVIRGSWQEDTNTLHQTSGSMGDTLAIFSLYNQSKANTTFSVAMQLMTPGSSAGSPMYIYFYYVDSNNWMRLLVDANGTGTTYAYKVQKLVSGVATDITTGTFPVAGAGTNCYPFSFIRHGHYKCSIFVGTDASDGASISAYDVTTTLQTDVDFSLFFNNLGYVAFGGLNQGLIFKNFRYIEFDDSLSIRELLQTIATKASIYGYKLPTTFEDYFFNPGNYNGTFTTPNRVLTIPGPAITTVMKTDLQIDNGEVEFEAKVNPTSGTVCSFDFIFRNTGVVSQNENYVLRFYQDSTADAPVITLYNTHTGTLYRLENSITYLHFDFNQYHKYRVSFFGGYIFLMIDNIVAYAWFDNNITSTPTTGYIGFRTGVGSKLEIKSVVGNDLFTQIETFSINPGDDLQNSVESLLETIKAYFFSDLMGRFKVLRLSSSDPSGYTYQNEITNQQVDNSDKEYVNQVTVVGVGVQATTQDASSINTNAIIREEVIVDYKITTYQDAVIRAQLELINFNKFNNQYSPRNILNVGSEIYDVVTVINTGSNSSNVNQTVRNYSQDIQVGGNKLSYWQSIQTGKL